MHAGPPFAQFRGRNTQLPKGIDKKAMNEGRDEPEGSTEVSDSSGKGFMRAVGSIVMFWTEA